MTPSRETAGRVTGRRATEVHVTESRPPQSQAPESPAPQSPVTQSPVTQSPVTPIAASPHAEWSLRRRVGYSFAGFAVLMAALFAVVVVSMVQFVSAGNDVIYRWQPAVTRSQDLLGDLVNQETGVRGYALGARPEYLEPYQKYAQSLTTDNAEMAKLIRGNRAMQARYAEFLAAAETWHRQVAAPVIAYVQAGDPRGLQLVNSPDSKAAFDRIRQSAAALTSAVEAKVSQVRADRRHAAQFVVTALCISALLVVGAAVAVWRGLHRWVLGPVDHLAGQTRLVAGGDLYRTIDAGGPPEFVDLGTDVETMRRRIAEELAHVERMRAELVVSSEELARSNADLQQFAYVASHDLSEPLRKVSNFCQLLERQYAGQLDDRAREYIAFAVDGAKRMQALISDLLALSRVGRTTETFEPVDIEQVVERAQRTFDERIRESRAAVVHGPMPTIEGDAALITSLFENLIGNALKYRGTEPPTVMVTAERAAEPGVWLFTVSDNGIGIDPQYAERIFAVFQRLHLRDEYGGTGIGLALCRKIVEYHGGHIWLDTDAAGPGATFRFTLPERPPGAP